MSMSVVVFMLNIIVFVFFGAVIFGRTSENSSRFNAFTEKYSKTISISGAAFALVSLILDITKIADMSGYKFISVWIIVLCLISEFSRRNKISENRRHLFNFCTRSFVVCLAAELFVFNLNSAHLIAGGYNKKMLDISSAVSENFDVRSRTNTGEGNFSLEFRSLGMPVGTLTVVAESDKSHTVKADVSISDDTHSPSYRNNIASVQIIKDYKRSETIPCNFSGSVHDMKISFNAASDETIRITKIEINSPIKLHFSIVRFIILFGSALAIYALVSPKMLYRRYSDVQGTVEVTAKLITAALILVSLFLTNMGRYRDGDHSLAKDFSLTSGNQITQEIVDSFENGRLDIMTDMNQALLELENPYDWSQRDNIGSYPWDHLLFEGKYYSYYGIAPVITLFWPYYKITGYYFPSSWAVWLFGVVGIIFLTKFYLCFIDKFFRKAYASIVLAGFVIMQLSTGIYFCYFAAYFYEIAQSSGFLWVTSGAYFLMSSNVIGDGKIKNARVAAAAFCLSMGVLSRPTIAVYCVAALFLIYAGFRKKRSLYDKKQSAARYYIPYFLCALAPFAVIGSVQIWYNYARFGNPFDFGIEYSLTINDFTRAEYHTHFAASGFFNFLFAIPSFSENFPFLKAEYPKLFSPNGYYFIATGSALGMIFKALPVAAYSKSLNAYRLSKNPEKKLYTVIIIAVCVVCPFIVIFSIWESGFAARYSVDFAWQMILGALIICFIIHEKCSKDLKYQLNKLMVSAMVLSVVMNFIQEWSYDNPVSLYTPEWQARALAFSRLFEFWR